MVYKSVDHGKKMWGAASINGVKKEYKNNKILSHLVKKSVIGSSNCTVITTDDSMNKRTLLFLLRLLLLLLKCKSYFFSDMGQ